MSTCRLLAGAIVLGGLPAAAGAADPVILYAPADGAAAAHDALRGSAATVRQGPAARNARWPRSARLGKASGRELSTRSAPEIASILRRSWSADFSGGRVAVDEITPAQWDVAAAGRLRRAMEILGSDARRVSFYASASLVEQVGRTDPRRALSPKLGGLLDAMSRGRSTYLQTYRGNLQPFPAREMATHPTRWRARWPGGRGTLHLLIGPDGGIGQRALWDRVRASAAGRALLANPPGGYGLRTAAAGRAWAARYRAHLRAPTARPPGGDVAVARPGGLTLTRSGPRAVRVGIGRQGRAVVSFRRMPVGARRAIRKLNGPTASPVLVRLPARVKPGRYQVQVVLQGNGLTDRRVVTTTIRRRPLRLRHARGVFTLTVPAGVRAVLRISPPRGRDRAIAKVVGPRTRRIPRPKDLRRGRHTAIAVGVGAGGRRQASVRFVVR